MKKGVGAGDPIPQEGQKLPHGGVVEIRRTVSCTLIRAADGGAGIDPQVGNFRVAGGDDADVHGAHQVFRLLAALGGQLILQLPADEHTRQRSDKKGGGEGQKNGPGHHPKGEGVEPDTKAAFFFHKHPILSGDGFFL